MPNSMAIMLDAVFFSTFFSHRTSDIEAVGHALILLPFKCIFKALVHCEQSKEKTTKKIFCVIYFCEVVLYQVVILLYGLLFFLINIRYEALFFECLSHKKVHVS